MCLRFKRQNAVLPTLLFNLITPVFPQETDGRKNFTMPLTFLRLRYIYYTEYTRCGGCTPYNNLLNNDKTMKRIYRNDMQQAQKQKISAANKGKRLSQHTRNLISRALQQYWAKLPYKPTSGTTTQGV